jgi:hypothetical protein
MTYRAYRPERRSRRRRWLLIALTLIAIVAAIALLASRQTEQRGTVEFYAAAEESAMTHGSASSSLYSTLERIGPLMTRQELTAMLEEIRATAVEAHGMLPADVPASVSTAYGSLAAASMSWVDGATEIERVIVGIMDAEIVDGAESELRGAIDLLRVGDVGYEVFRGVVGSSETTSVTIPDFTAVRYVAITPGDEQLYDAQNLVLKIQAAYNLAPRHNLGIIGSTDPVPIGDRGGIPLVPFAESIAVQAVVSNAGNEEERDIPVELTVLDVDAGTTLTDSRTIESLAAGASTTVLFSDLDLTPGGLYEVRLATTIPLDNDPDNDSWTLTFIWNEES